MRNDAINMEVARACWPSGLRFLLVSMPWPLSMTIFIAEVVFRFLYVSYEKSGRKASCARFIS